MSAEQIQFLMMRRRGVGPEEAFAPFIEQAQRELDERVRAAAEQLAARQWDVENRSASLVARVAQVDVIVREQEQVEGLQREVAQLREAKADLQGALSDKEQELVLRQQKTKELTKKLASLSDQLKKVPGPNEQFCVEYGQRVVDRMIGCQQTCGCDGRSSFS